MVLSATIRPEQIIKAKRLLKELPKRTNRQTRREAAKVLAGDFQKAQKKGYNFKELSAILKNEGIIIPIYLIEEFCAEVEMAKVKPSSEKKES